MRPRISMLIASNGMEYLGLAIREDDVTRYISQLKDHLGQRYSLFNENRVQRDGNSYHITIINPFELPSLTKEQQNEQLGVAIEIRLLKLGKVELGRDSSFFVVVAAPAINALRAKYHLGNCHPHITLGFNTRDIHGLAKDLSASV